VPARLIKIKYATTRVEKVASPITALHRHLPAHPLSKHHMSRP